MAPTAAAARDLARPSGNSVIYDRNDSAAGIDWRRSANSDRLFVREREWEAAHTAWLWVDLSPSMRFRSSLSETSKESRAVVLALAMTELLARGGERVGVIGGLPFRGRGATRRVAEILMGETGRRELTAAGEAQPFLRMPHVQRLSRAGAGDQRAARGDRSARRARPSRPILDPAEETLPYSGRTEFAASEGKDRMIAGRAETLRERYQERLKQHRTDLAAMTERLGWSFIVHHTDRPAEEVLLVLHNRLAGLERDYRYRAPRSSGTDTATGRAP